MMVFSKARCRMTAELCWCAFHPNKAPDVTAMGDSLNYGPKYHIPRVLLVSYCQQKRKDPRKETIVPLERIKDPGAALYTTSSDEH